MLRSFLNQAVRSARPLLETAPKLCLPKNTSCLQSVGPSVSLISSRWMGTNFGGLLRTPVFSTFKPTNLLSRVQPAIVEQKRTAYIKYNHKNARQKSDFRVLRRFMRLDWGMWIHVRSGREKKLWKKRGKCKKRLRHHVMCTASQNNLLDKMVTKRYRRTHYFVEDPYAPYHMRESYLRTRKEPLPLPP